MHNTLVSYKRIVFEDQLLDPKSDDIKVSDTEAYHIYNGSYLTLADECPKDFYWLWNEGAWDDSDPDSINDVPWTKEEILKYLTFYIGI